MTASQSWTRPPPAATRSGWRLLVVVVAVALNLRPAIAAVPYLTSLPRSFYAAKGRGTSELRGFSLLDLIHPTPWKGRSAKFALKEF